MGAANIERIFVAQVNSIFLIVSAVLAVLVGLKTKNLIKTLLSSVPVFCILGYALIRTGHPWYEKYLSYQSRQRNGILKILRTGFR